MTGYLILAGALAGLAVGAWWDALSVEKKNKQHAPQTPNNNNERRDQ